MDLTAVREALASNLSAITGTQVSAYMLLNPSPPAAHVFPSEIEFDRAMGRGLDFQVLTVQVIVGTVSNEAAQRQLDAYLAGSGPQSVKAALESDKKLGGACSDLRVTGATGYRTIVQEGQAPVLVCDWRVEIHGSGI
jgi:hypothetical protein